MSVLEERFFARLRLYDDGSIELKLFDLPGDLGARLLNKTFTQKASTWLTDGSVSVCLDWAPPEKENPHD